MVLHGILEDFLQGARTAGGVNDAAEGYGQYGILADAVHKVNIGYHGISGLDCWRQSGLYPYMRSERSLLRQSLSTLTKTSR